MKEKEFLSRLGCISLRNILIEFYIIFTYLCRKLHFNFIKIKGVV